MDDPPFYRDDLQSYYDLQLASGKSEAEAVREVKKRFKVRSLTVTPTGEVRSPGIVDNPDPPEAPVTEPPEDDRDRDDDRDDDRDRDDDEDRDDKDDEDPPKKPEEGAVDAAWVSYLDSDMDLDGFEAWAVRERCLDEADVVRWEAPDVIAEHWRPDHLPSKNARRDAVRELPVAKRDLYERFSRLVNMRAGEIRAHLRSASLREMVAATRKARRRQLIEGRRLARQVLRMKALPVQEWDATLWSQCRVVVTQIERHRRNSAPLLAEGNAPTRKLFALRLLGHNPTVAPRIAESEIAHLLQDRNALHRFVDATPGCGLPALVEERSKAVPDFDALKAARVDLDDDERAVVMDAGAIWHRGPKGSPSSAVWKAELGGQTYYVCNTHRLYQVRSSLDAAVSAYHRVVKQTA